jgi:hypothetical protein
MSDGRDGVYIHIICASRCCVMCRVLLCRAVSSWVCAAAWVGKGRTGEGVSPGCLLVELRRGRDADAWQETG